MVFSQIIFIGIVFGMFSHNFIISNAQAQKAPSTLGIPANPNSGLTRNRSNVMGGASSSSEASNLDGRAVPSSGTQTDNRQEEQEKADESFKSGPYNQKGEYQYLSPDE